MPSSGHLIFPELGGIVDVIDALQRPVANARSAGRVAVVLGLLFGLAGTSSSAVTVALPALATALDVSTSTAVWVISGYTVALAVATALHGRLADMVGIRTPLVVGVLLMVGGAIAAAAAPAFGLLLGGRIVQGFGAAAIPVLATALVSARWDGATRASALARVAGMAATFSALGPTIGGALEEVGGWRWAIALPAVGLLALPVLWREAPRTGSGESLDVFGALAVAVTATGLVLLIQSPSAGLLAAGVGALLVLAGVPAAVARIRARPHGFLPRAIITNRTVLRNAFASGAIPAGWFALLLGVPIALTAWGWSPLSAGLVLLPAAVMGLVVQRVGPAVRARLDDHSSITVACGIAMTALLVAALGAAVRSPVLLAAGVTLVTLGFGIGQPAMISSVGAAVAVPQRGVALGVATLVFLVGAGIGAATVGGLAELIGVAGALLALVLLPLAGTAAMLLVGTGRHRLHRHRPEVSSAVARSAVPDSTPRTGPRSSARTGAR